jgi:hypothetical protein
MHDMACIQENKCIPLDLLPPCWSTRLVQILDKPPKLSLLLWNAGLQLPVHARKVPSFLWFQKECIVQQTSRSPQQIQDSQPREMQPTQQKPKIQNTGSCLENSSQPQHQPFNWRPIKADLQLSTSGSHQSQKRINRKSMKSYQILSHTPLIQHLHRQEIFSTATWRNGVTV